MKLSWKIKKCKKIIDTKTHEALAPSVHDPRRSFSWRLTVKLSKIQRREAILQAVEKNTNSPIKANT